MKFGTEIDLEIIRIVKHIKETASFFKLRNTETERNIQRNPNTSGTVMKNKYFFFNLAELRKF